MSNSFGHAGKPSSHESSSAHVADCYVSGETAARVLRLRMKVHRDLSNLFGFDVSNPQGREKSFSNGLAALIKGQFELKGGDEAIRGGGLGHGGYSCVVEMGA